MDRTDHGIIDQLRLNARAGYADIGAEVGLSASAVKRRIDRLVADGVIRGYRADVDPRALGYSLSAVMRIKPAPRQLPKVAELAIVPESNPPPSWVTVC